MPKPTRLPDVMPDIEKPTLLLVCDSHHCVFVDVGNHTLVVDHVVESKKNTFTDKEGRYQSPGAGGKGGIMGGLGDKNPLEKNRMKEFANVIVAHLGKAVTQQGIEEIFISAPNKFLACLKDHLTKPLLKKVRDMQEGNFVKDAPIDLLLRFRPDLKVAAKKLREQENYSAKKRLPK